MPRQEPPEWWVQKRRGPTIGCADVTIISITSIAAFVILIMVLIKPDLAGIFEQLPGQNNNKSVVVAPTVSPAPSPSPTVRVTSTPLPLPTATPAPPAPTALKKAKTIEICNLRPEPRIASGTKGQIPVGVTFKLLGERRETTEAVWQSVEQDDNPANRGWMWEKCFDLTKTF